MTKILMWIGLLNRNERELSCSDYRRVSVLLNADGTIGPVVFPQATSQWETVHAIGLYTCAQGSSPVSVIRCDNDQDVYPGDSLDCDISNYEIPVDLNVFLAASAPVVQPDFPVNLSMSVHQRLTLSTLLKRGKSFFSKEIQDEDRTNK